MKSSTALLSLAILAVAALAYGALFLTTPASSQQATDSFAVAFDEQPALDHVCFVMDVSNTIASDTALPLKPLLNATSIDVQKATTKLYAERETLYSVTSCNACEIESCVEDNVTEQVSCQNVTVTDCSRCGSTESMVPRKAWEEVSLASTEKILTGGKENQVMKNEFSSIAMKAGKPERYKLCYYFNEIPINPSTGMPGSYGFMYLDLGGKLYYDFEHSSWWNDSYPYRYRILSNVTTTGLPISINGTSLPNVWVNNATEAIYLYCEEEGCDSGLMTVANISSDVCWERTFPEIGNCEKNVWNNGPVVALHLDENSGTTAFDSTGFGNNATFHNSPVWQTSGVFGRSLRFDTVDHDYLTVADSTSLDVASSFTAMMWIKTNAADGMLIEHALDSCANQQTLCYTGWKFGIGFTGSHRLTAFCSNGDGSLTWVGGGNTKNVSTGQWVHVALTYDGTHFRFYVNGTNDSIVSPADDCIEANNYVNIASEGPSFSYFGGYMDDVRIYNRTLGATEIYEIYQSGINNMTKLGSIESTVELYNITFHIYSAETGENLTNVNVYCSNSWAETIDNGHKEEFYEGDYSCIFGKTDFYNKTVEFTVDGNKTVDVEMSQKAYLTIEEHTWLQAVYDCLHTGDCLAMNLLLEINETTQQTWNQFKPTDWSIVEENIISNFVNSTSNITINYTINVPKKDGYGLIAGIQGYDDFLPIRMSYWFLDSETATSCYSQGEYDVAPVEPYCKPVVAYTVGQILTQTNFTIEIHPDLPAGSYYMVRKIEIDPDNVWIDYGQEIIGDISVLEDSSQTGVDIKNTDSTSFIDEISGDSANNVIETEAMTQESQKDAVPLKDEVDDDVKVTGHVIGNVLDPSYISIIVSMATLTIVLFIYRNSKSRKSPWGY